jgi:hypothetical protein
VIRFGTEYNLETEHKDLLQRLFFSERSVRRGRTLPTPPDVWSVNYICLYLATERGTVG